MRVAVYPGTFDPVTLGHRDIVERGLRLFDRIIVAIGLNPKKIPLFTLEERLFMLRETFREYPQVEVTAFEGLLVAFARSRGAQAILRGLRALSDFELEFQMALMNRKLDAQIEMVYLMPSEEYSYLTSSIIKEVAQMGGEVGCLVPPVVREMLERKFPCSGQRKEQGS